MNIQILDATEADFPVVQNLVRFYVYDMSETMGWPCPDDGLYGGCDDLPEYWWTGSTPEELEAINRKLAIFIPYNLHFDRWPAGCCGHPFMIRVDGELAGFALIKQLNVNHTVVYDVGEFFVVRKFRRKGIGKSVAYHLFDHFHGIWQVRQMVEHHTAQAFWRRIIADYSENQYHESKQHFEEYGIDMIVQQFTSPRQR
ncbi:MAG: GNAT family N-acetyltransferase [Chloroflexota bacterium]